MSRKRRAASVVRTIFLVGSVFFLLLMSSTLIWAVAVDIPSIDGFHNRRVVESTKIYDRTGKVLLYDVHGTVRRTTIPLEDMSVNIKNAAVAIEDTEFYQHHGFRPLSFIRAVLANIASGSYAQGGSTITQQVVKNTLLTKDKKVVRKVKEIVLALRLEKLMTKDQILEVYLNETPYGGTLYGIEEASKYYFAKGAKDLSLPEAAYLAAIPQAPTYYSPFGNHRDELEKRKNLVLQRMYESGFISAEEYAAAKTSSVEFQAVDDTGIKASHFVFFVREYLEEKYGVEAVNEGGLTVITTLDYDLQKYAEEVVKRYALENEQKFNAENAGLVAIDPKTGQVLSMVGSRGYFDESIDGKYNITLAKRQPGSSFKPFVYATAFSRGYTPETVVFDLKTQFSITCAPDLFETNDLCYSPDNYDNVFRGPMTLRDALAQSVNIPAVKVLYLAGIPQSLTTARALGITTLTQDQAYYGLPLVLGGGEVMLYEMVSAYGVFANDGVRHDPTPILKVEDTDDRILEEYKDSPGEQVLDAEVARTMSDVLSDNTARTPAFGENSSLYFPEYDVAAKTGTTNDYRDAWVIGYTPSIAIGAWAGNNNNTPMEKRVAGFIVAPLWNEVMQFALTHSERSSFTPPTPKDIAALPAPLRGAWNEVGAHDILYSVNKNNPLIPAVNPENDPQFERWEYPVRLWSGLNPDLASTTPPTPVVRAPDPRGALLLTYPQNGSIVPSSSFLTITTQSPFGAATRRVSFQFNGISIGSSTKAPFSLTIAPSLRGPVSLQAIAESDTGRVVDEVRFVIE